MVPLGPFNTVPTSIIVYPILCSISDKIANFVAFINGYCIITYAGNYIALSHRPFIL